MTDDDEYRTSIEEVRGGGFSTSLDDDEIAEIIDDANLEVEEKLADTGMTDRRLSKIERELVRHAIKYEVEEERMVESEDIGPASLDYVGAFSNEEALRNTPHGQKALRLDTSDTLGEGESEFWSVHP